MPLGKLRRTLPTASAVTAGGKGKSESGPVAGGLLLGCSFFRSLTTKGESPKRPVAESAAQALPSSPSLAKSSALR